MLTDCRLLNGWDQDRWNLLFLVSIGLLILGAGIGLRDPWPADEPRFALVAKQMVESGQWLFPFRGGEIYPDKPPMFMWGIAIGYVLTGSMRIAFLLPSLLAAMGCVALVYDVCRRMWDRSTAFRAALLLIFTVQFTVQAKQAQIDELVTFFITLGGYGFLRFLFCGGGWRWYYLGWFAAGLGIITKGVGIIAVLMLLPALWTHRQSIKAAQKADWIKALLGPIMLLVACSLWVLPMVFAVQQHPLAEYIAYRNNILFRQTVTRYANAWHHIKPFWFYLTSVIPPFWLPWSLLLPWVIWRVKSQWRAKPEIFVLAIYLVLIILFFSISAGKRGVYITPATPILAMLTAYWLPELLVRRWPARLLSGLAWLLSVIFLVAAVVLKLKPELSDKLGEGLSFAWMLGASLGVLGIFVSWFLRKQPLTAMMTVMALLWFHYGFWSYPLMNHLRTPKDIMETVAEQIGTNDELLLTNFREQFLLFTPRPVEHFAYAQPDEPQPLDAAVWVEQKSNRWVLGPINNLRHCFDATKGHELGIRHGDTWYLFDASAILPTCSHGMSSGAEIYHYEPKLFLGD